MKTFYRTTPGMRISGSDDVDHCANSAGSPGIVGATAHPGFYAVKQDMGTR
jgi:hypothetical protein